jgi:hypothetical protein
MRIRLVVLQKVRIWVHGTGYGWVFPKNISVLYLCINFNGSEFHAGTLLRCERFTAFNHANKHVTRSQRKENRHQGKNT